ncbi:MAG: hypothetical protein EOP88_14535 [Verrucomicrobiaceae bacterium]|nr:MAG: hypothetical protein EOP88_14535 [Verrucomicrobiaceae bacterium]
MNYRNTFVFLVLLAPFTAFGGVQKLIDDLLAKELAHTNEGLFPISWAYSNEGGVIKYAEMDLVGDDRKDIIYWRSTQSMMRDVRTTAQVYFQPQGDENYVGVHGQIFFGDFHKKENGKSIFLKASEGDNHDTPEEPAFTKTLVIQEVTTRAVESKTIRIDGHTEDHIKEMWRHALFTGDRESIVFMNGLGFSEQEPTYKWISLKDYLKGGEWKIDNVNEWTALNEFEAGAATWLVPKDSITPSFLEFARQARERLREQPMRQDEYGIPYKEIDFPEGYLSPQLALQLLLEKVGTAGKSSGAGLKISTAVPEPNHGDGQPDSKTR